MENYTGIWMDGDQAIVMTFEDGKTTSKRVKSKIHHHKVKGGSRTSTPYARQGPTSTRSSLERKKNQQKAYFKELKALLKNATGIYLFGPSTMKVLFYKILSEDKNLSDRILGVDRSDSMSKAQMIAQAKSFFQPYLNEKAYSS